MEIRPVSTAQETCFLIHFDSDQGERLARLVVESLRTFGGPLRACPVWAFSLDPERASHGLASIAGVRCHLLTLPDVCQDYPFTAKVAACARAEEMAGPEVRSLVWLSLDSLIVRPPLLLDLGPNSGLPPAGAAFRPVHHRNIGSPAHEPLDDFWQGVYSALGIEDTPHAVESFVDRQRLRPYWNTHSFAFDPSTGLARAWWAGFQALVADRTFQDGPCRDALHRVFLHQAILSALVLKLLAWEQIRLLPPAYSYPLNLLHEMPPERRAPSLNSLVSAVYEDAFPWSEIAVEEPLRSWLIERLPDDLKPVPPACR